MKRKALSGIMLTLLFIGMLPLVFNVQTAKASGPPQFCSRDFTELEKIEAISKFRSFSGHDYSDSYENNRSMKHYFAPRNGFKETAHSIKIFSPVNGRIRWISEEQHTLSTGEKRGYQVHISVNGFTTFTVILFHVNISSGLNVWTDVVAGQEIGYADVREAFDFDITIERRVTFWTYKLYSYFQVMTDEVFALYQARGIENRTQMIKTKEEVDSSPYSWSNPDPNDWVFLSAYYQLTVTSSPITGITFTINDSPKTTPYTEWLLEGSYTLEMPQTHNGYFWSHWLEDGDTNRIKTITLPGTT